MSDTNKDANVSNRHGIETLEEYQHKIYRLAISNSRDDLFYASCVEDLDISEIIEFLNDFNYSRFSKFTEEQKEEIFNRLVSLQKDLIISSDKLRKKYINNYNNK